MKKNNLFLIGLIFLVSCSSSNSGDSVEPLKLPFYVESTFTPNWFSREEAKRVNIHTIPAFDLINQNGEHVTDRTVEGKIYVVDFFFTSCPGICKKMTNNMMDVQAEFKDDSDVMILSHSVTPENDSVPILKNYADGNGIISGKWHLLTGQRKTIYDLGRKSYFIEEDLGEERAVDEFLHTENFVLIDQHKRIRGIYNGLKKSDVAQMIEDIRTLKQE